MAGIGFEPINVLGQGYPVQNGEYAILNGYTSSIHQGDPVCMGADGTIKLGTVTLINNADCIGVFMGCAYNNAAGQRVFDNRWPASTASDGAVAYVADNPLTKFRVKILTSGVDATLDWTSVGFQADLDATTAGSAQTGLSGYGLETAGATAGTSNFRIVSLTNEVNGPDDKRIYDNVAAYTHAIVIVQPDLHYFNQGAGI